MYPLLIAAIVFTVGNDTWTSNGPLGGFLQCIEYNANGYLYVGVRGGGVYRKLRFTNPWQPANNGIEPVSIVSLKSLGRDTLLGGMEGYGLVRTIDGGLNWYQNPDIPSTSVNDILAFSGLPNIMLIAADAGTYVSTNRGNNWVRTDTVSRVSCVAAPRDTIAFCGTDYHGIYYSTNWGVTWRLIPSQPDNQINDVEFAFKASVSYFFAGTERGLFYSTDYGTSWRPTSLANVSISRIDFATDTIYVSTFGGGVWRSTVDNPTGYTQLRNGLACLIVSDMFTPSSTELYAATSGGFFYGYTETNRVWSEDLAGLNTQSIQDIDVLPNGRVFAATLGGGIYQSTNNGLNWQRTPTTPPISLFLALAVDPTDDQNMVAGAMFALVYVTTDGGQNWNYYFIDTLTNLGSVYSLALDSAQPSNVFAGTDSGLYRSTDGGRLWQRAMGVPRIATYDICIDPRNGQNVYVATAGRIFKSTDGGRNFALSSFGIPVTLQTYRVRADHTNPAILYTSFSFTNLGVYKTANGGAIWSGTTVRDSITAIATGDLPYQVLLGSNNRGIALSSDSLHRVTPFNRGLTSPRIICSEMSVLANRSAYAGTANGVFVYTDTTRPTPQILLVGDSIFSPDGDTLDDVIGFTVSHGDSGRIAQWWMRMRKDTTILSSVQGIGEPAGTYVWDGFDLAGRKVQNGYYQAYCVLQDNFGNIDSVSRTIYANARPLVSGQRTASAAGNGRKVVRDHSGVLHAVYSTYPVLGPTASEIFYTSSSNGGVTWSDPVDLSNSKTRLSLAPAITVDINDSVWVVWEELVGLRNCVYYTRGKYSQWWPADSIYGSSNSARPVIFGDNTGSVHVVWEGRQPSGSDDISHKKWTAGLWSATYNVSQNASDSRTPTLGHNTGDSLWVVWSDSSSGADYDLFARIYRLSTGQWQAPVQVTGTPAKSLGPSVVSDLSGNLHVIWSDSVNAATAYVLYRKYDPRSGWDTVITGISDSTHKARFPSIASDSSANLYTVWEEDESRVVARTFDHQLGWQVRTTFSDTASSVYPNSSTHGEVIWTERTSTPFNVRFRAFTTLGDITPPRLTISAPDTLALGDTLRIYVVSDEILREPPRVLMYDADNESIGVTMSDDTSTALPYDFEGSAVSRGLAQGAGRIRAWGTDPSGNQGTNEKAVLIRLRGSFLPPDSVFAFPNPTRRDYVNFMFYINQNALVQIEVFTISGRRVARIPDNPGRYDGGMFHEERFSLGRLGTDVYIFRVKAEAIDGNEAASVKKKFGVIR